MQGLIGMQVIPITENVIRMNGVVVMHSHALPPSGKRRILTNHGGIRVIAMDGSVFQSYHVKIIPETIMRTELQNPGNVYVMLDIQKAGMIRDLPPAHSAQRGNLAQPGIQRCAEITQLVLGLLKLSGLRVNITRMQHVFVKSVMGHQDLVARNVRLVITKVRKASQIQGVQNVR
jgi:hypothetical protein